MSAIQDFETGCGVGLLVVLLGAGVFVVGVAAWALWQLHPGIILFVGAPILGGLGNIAFQWARRKWGRA